MQIRLAIIAFAVFIISSCKDEPAEIAGSLFGDNLINAKEYIAGSNEVSLQNVEGEVVTFNQYTYLLLGEYYDSQFGYLKSDFASGLSVTPATIDSIEINSSEEIDTLIFMSCTFDITYYDGSWYGDTTALHHASFFEVTESLENAPNTSDFNPNNYSNDTPIGELEYGINKVSQKTAIIRNNDTVFHYLLSANIDDEIGERILQADWRNLTDSKEYNSKLDSLLKGIYITSNKADENNEGSVLKLDYRNVSQRLTIHYCRVDTVKDTEKDSIISIDIDTTDIYFPINVEQPIAMQYKRDYTGSDVDLETPNPDKIYLSSYGGSMAKLNISDELIKNWKEILPEEDEISEAKSIQSLSSVTLQLYVDTLDNNHAYAPEYLYLYYLNENNELSAPKYVSSSETDLPIMGSGSNLTSAALSSDYSYVFNLKVDFFKELIYPSQEENSTRKLKELYISTEPYTSTKPYTMNQQFVFRKVLLNGFTVTKSETIKPSKFSVKYVEAQ